MERCSSSGGIGTASSRMFREEIDAKLVLCLDRDSKYALA